MLPALGLWWLYARHGVHPRDCGLRASPDLEAPGLVFVAVMAAVLFWVLHEWVNQLWRWYGDPQLSWLHTDMITSSPSRPAAVIYMSLGAGFTEEILFRGLPLLVAQDFLAPRRRAAWYCTASSVLFGAAHWDNGIQEFFSTMLIGIAASLIYLRFRSLLPLIAAHTLVDLWLFWPATSA